jgi:hypothetical protein
MKELTNNQHCSRSVCSGSVRLQTTWNRRKDKLWELFTLAWETTRSQTSHYQTRLTRRRLMERLYPLRRETDEPVANRRPLE